MIERARAPTSASVPVRKKKKERWRKKREDARARVLPHDRDRVYDAVISATTIVSLAASENDRHRYTLSAILSFSLSLSFAPSLSFSLSILIVTQRPRVI